MSEYDYGSLCAVCASTYKLCESELSIGCFCLICYIVAYARGIYSYQVTIRVNIDKV